MEHKRARVKSPPNRHPTTTIVVLAVFFVGDSTEEGSAVAEGTEVGSTVDTDGVSEDLRSGVYLSRSVRLKCSTG